MMDPADSAGPSRPASQQKAGIPRSQPCPPEGIHVLLVDDERLSRMIVGNLLRQCEYKVTEANSGLTALEALRCHEPGTFNLILTIHSVDVATENLLSLMVMSANEHRDTVFECIQYGAEDYLVKPVSRNAIQCIWQHVWRRQVNACVPQARDEAEEEVWPANRAGAVPVVGSWANSFRANSTRVATATQAGSKSVGPERASPIRRSASDETLNSDPPVGRRAPSAPAVRPPVRWPAPPLHEAAQLRQSLGIPRVSSDAELRRPAPREAPDTYGRVVVSTAPQPGQSAAPAVPANAPSGSFPVLDEVMDQSILQYLEVRRSVNPADSLRLLHATIARLAPSHQRGEAFKMVRPSLLWLGSDWVLRTMPRGPYFPVVTDDVRQLEAACYASPEELLGREPTPASDIYSLGILTVELFHNYTRTGEREEVLKRLKHRFMPDQIFRHQALHAFVVAMLNPRAELRPTLQQVWEHPFLARLTQEMVLRQQQAAASARPSRLITPGVVRQHTVVTDALAAAKRAAEEEQRQQQQGLCEQSEKCSTSGSSDAMDDPVVRHLLRSFLTKVVKKRKREARALRKQIALLQSDLDYTTEQLEEIRVAKAAKIQQQQQQQLAILKAPKQVRCDRDAQPSTSRQSERQLALPGQAGPSGTGPQERNGNLALAVRATPGSLAPYQARWAGARLADEKWKRMQPSLHSLQEVFFKRKAQQRPGILGKEGQASSKPPLGLEDLDDSLTSFAEDLVNVSRYSELKVKATLRSFDRPNHAEMICSIAIDRDDDLFAAAGISRTIKIYSLSEILDPDLPQHYPRFQILGRAKLSCVAYNSYIKSKLVAADTDGLIVILDGSNGQLGVSHEEHTRTVRSVDFSRTDPSRFVSGSDDGTVRLWSLNCDRCVQTIDFGKNPVCSVQWSPSTSQLIACASANYRVYFYDLRRPEVPAGIIDGHSRAVSYVRWMNSRSLVTASIDGTLKLWNVDDALTRCHMDPVTTFRGHRNEKNFVGLGVLPSGYMVCGSEDNSVYAYYQALADPIVHQSFITGPGNPLLDAQGEQTAFVSTICPTNKGSMLLAANSVGTVKVMELC